MIMNNLNRLGDSLPDFARDIKLNLHAVLQSSTLTVDQRWGLAITSASTVRHRALQEATLADARRHVDERVVEDALAAATLMGMNNVYYRFRHLVGKPSYAEKPARLRMNRILKPATTKLDFELFCLAASAINGCETCIQAHEKVVVDGGITEDAVHDAIRIAATMKAAALALELTKAEQADAAA